MHNIISGKPQVWTAYLVGIKSHTRRCHSITLCGCPTQKKPVKKHSRSTCGPVCHQVRAAPPFFQTKQEGCRELGSEPYPPWAKGALTVYRVTTQPQSLSLSPHLGLTLVGADCLHQSVNPARCEDKMQFWSRGSCFKKRLLEGVVKPCPISIPKPIQKNDSTHNKLVYSGVEMLSCVASSSCIFIWRK